MILGPIWSVSLDSLINIYEANFIVIVSPPHKLRSIICDAYSLTIEDIEYFTIKYKLRYL